MALLSWLGPTDRGPAAGTGWVRATTGHQYADAQQRGNPVTLLVSETTGALSRPFCAALREMGKAARAPGTHDSTCYGTASTSPAAFYGYARHLAEIESSDRTPSSWPTRSPCRTRRPP